MNAINRLLTVLFSSTMLLAPMAVVAMAEEPVTLLSAGLVDDRAADDALTQPMPAAAEPLAEVSAATPDAAADVASPVKGPDAVELAALYYYAAQKEENRVDAEIKRLSAKYPGFVPPKDLHADPARRSVSEKTLWAFYDKNDFRAVDAEIARLSKETPGWTPSEDFTAKLARKKLRTGMEQATAMRDWSRVIALGGKLDPQVEKEVDLLWDVIDAHAALNNKAEAARFYRGILMRTENVLPKEALVTTIQKATRDFSPEDIRAVIAHFSADPDFALGLASVQTDLVRREVADFNADETRKDKLPDATIEALRKAADAESRIADLSLLGWYDLKVGDPVDAGIRFRTALDKEPKAEHAKGLYLSLIRQDRKPEAFDLALQYQKDLESDPVFLMNALSERFSHPETGEITADAVKAYSATILKSSSPEHAEILAWYAYNTEQYQSSAAWFAKAVTWKPAEARVKGLALSYARLSAKAELIALYRQYAQAYPAIWDDIRLGRGKPAKTGKKKPDFLSGTVDGPDASVATSAIAKTPAFLTEDEPKAAASKTARVVKTSAKGYLAAFEAKRYSECLASLQSMESTGRLTADQSLIKGWCILGLNRLAEARTAFSQALGGSARTRQDASYGMALTFLRAKLSDDAENTITLYPLSASRDKEVRAEIWWQRARSAFDEGRYQAVLEALNARIALVPEPANLSQMRAWAHFKLGHKAEARAIFERLNMHMDDPAIRRGLGVTGDDVSMAQ